MDPRRLAKAIAAGRLAFGAALLAIPEPLVVAWLGGDGRRAGARVLARSVGARDLVLGAGALACSEPDLRNWVLGAAVADTTDLVATLAAGREVPLRGRVLVGALAAGAAASGALAAARLARN